MNDVRFRLPAEWERQQAVLMAWPHADTDWAPRLEEVRDTYVEIARAICPRADLLVIAPCPEEARQRLEEIGHKNIRIVECLTNDTWTRDYGFITTLHENGSRCHDFKFDGWGLKFAANHDNMSNRRLLLDCGMCQPSQYVSDLDFVLEGGSIESDGEGTIMTTSECLCSPNRNGTADKTALEYQLHARLGAQRVLWIDHGFLRGDDTDSHVDTLARFLPGNTIALTTCDRPEDEHFDELAKMRRQTASFRTADGKPYNLVELPIPEPIFDEDGERLPATYANFLILNGAILLPVYASPKYDDIAISRLKEACPGYEIVPIDCRELIRQHGSLHCATMQIPVNTIKI